MSLQNLGWTPELGAAFAALREEGLEPGRVAREDRGRYRVLGAAGERTAELSGRLRHDATTRDRLPSVGDWVALKATSGDLAIVTALLPRRSAFARKVAGETTEVQIVAANVDTVFIVVGLDQDFNLRRVERYLTAAWESGASPVVVLNKADLTDDVAARTAEVEAVGQGVPVLPVSAITTEGLDVLDRWLGRGQTVALLGSSGVGKSTLLNALLGETRQATGAVRETDSRGRHTTTRRELIALPGGALLIDTPGMRELQLWGDESGVEQAFPDVASLAADCRFRDCGHDQEPGCAVQAALGDGSLEAARFESWRKLQRELRWLEVRQDARARAEEVAKWKAITKSMKHHPKAHRWR